MKSIVIPFQGFYGSDLAERVDFEILQLGESLEAVFAAKAMAEDVYTVLNKHTNYYKIYYSIAENYAERFSDEAEKILKLKLGLKFDDMMSPQEYNAETDRIFMKIPTRTILALEDKSQDENHSTLDSLVKQRFTNYDGFYSHYSNELDEWLKLPVDEWDHNQLGALLEACLLSEDSESLDEIEEDITEGLMGNAGISEPVWAGIRWESVASDLGVTKEQLFEVMQEFDSSLD